jgi:hypothetical protein
MNYKVTLFACGLDMNELGHRYARPLAILPHFVTFQSLFSPANRATLLQNASTQLIPTALSKCSSEVLLPKQRWHRLQPQFEPQKPALIAFGHHATFDALF